MPEESLALTKAAAAARARKTRCIIVPTVMLTQLDVSRSDLRPVSNQPGYVYFSSFRILDRRE